MAALGSASKLLTSDFAALASMGGDNLSNVITILGQQFSVLSEKQILELASSNKLNLGIFQQIIAKAKLTDKQRANLLVTYQQIAAANGEIAATEGATFATWSLSDAIDGLTLSIKMNPLLWFFTAAAVAIPVVIKLYDAFTVSAEEQAEKMRDLGNAYEEYESKVESLRAELKTTKERLDELNKLAKEGRLTPDQTAELRDLREMNAELERSLAIQQKLAEETKKEAEEAAVSTYNKKTYRVVYDNSGASFSPDAASPDGQITDADYDMTMNGIDAMESLMGTIKMLEKSKADLDEEFSKPGSLLTSDEYAERTAVLEQQIQDFRSQLKGVAEDLQADAEHMYGVTSAGREMKSQIASALDSYAMMDMGKEDALAYMANMESLSGPIAQLKELGKAGQVTIQTLRDDSAYKNLLVVAGNLGITVGELVDYFNATGESAKQAETYLGDLTGALSDVLDRYEILTDTTKEFNETGKISADTLAKIVEKFGEGASTDLTSNVAEYIAGMRSANELLNDLQEAYQTDESNFTLSIKAKLSAMPEFYDGLTKNQKTLVDDLADSYGVDLTNFKSVESKKLEFQAQIIAKLAANYSKYNGASLTTLRSILFAKQMGFNDVVRPTAAQQKEMDDIRNTIKQIESFNEQLDSIVFEGVSFDPSSYLGSSSAKSSNDAANKEIEKTKSAFQAVYNEKKHLVDMDKMTLEDFYAWLNGENGYKKYFSDLTKYADEYRKYEKEVFDGLRQIHEDYIEDLGFEIDMLERQDGAETQVIAKLREKQAAYRQLLLDTEAYLRAAGMSEEQIARNDLVQEYTKAMYAVEDSIREVEERLYEDSRDKINDLIDLTEDMVKQEKEDMIDALEAQKDAYSNLISQRKELLQLAQREKSYADEVADKNSQIQKIQSRIEDLSLDDSRTAAIEKAKLQEELATLQKELADKQNDHYVETTEDALDKELKEFESTQDKKIDAIQAFLKDNEALNREALKRLDNMNQELFNNLERYAMKYTDTTREELVGMWNEAARAAEKYGSVTNAKEVFSDSDSSTAVQSILQQMKANGNKWTTAKTDAERKQYADANLVLGAKLKELLGKDVYRDGNGVWWIGNQKLFTYHSGTPNVGGQPTLKQTEVFAKLEKGESVITPKHQSAITRLLSFFDPVEKVAKAISANQFSQYQFAGAGGPNVNVTIPLTLYGDMTAETMRVLKEHRREVADVVSKVLK